ncbi:MAG: TIM barrel protein [Chloroflexota bacterium]|mgnify:FL=1|jgi:hydroxypyruvate isomerase|nr:TIM barrel protein [Chloroflexota bacterium]|tara:strand:- start:71049 stop:71843 length:795 start_codon:yes stop_codon:yes gene_type:complete
MPKFESNLMYMYNEFDLIDRYEQASLSGFSGVELQSPYSMTIDNILDKLDKFNLKHVIINLPVIDPDTGIGNLALRPDKKDLFLERLDLGTKYARALGCIGINTGIGVYPSEFENDEVYQTLIQNQKIASETLSKYEIKALIEPINTVDQPDFYINTSAQAVDLINQIDHPNAFLLYDVYHMQIMEGNLSRNIKKLIDLIGHIQIADNPGRYEPGTGEINYPYIFNLLDEIGYKGWVGCEYKPSSNTLDSLGWIKEYLNNHHEE